MLEIAQYRSAGGKGCEDVRLDEVLQFFKEICSFHIRLPSRLVLILLDVHALQEAPERRRITLEKSPVCTVE